MRVHYPHIIQYRYGSFTEEAGWFTTDRKQAVVFLDRAKAQEGVAHITRIIEGSHGTVALEEVRSFDPDWCCPPGGTIRELIEHHKLSDKEVSERLGLSEGGLDLYFLLRGELSISPELAIKLHEVLGGTPQYWQALDENYREGIRRGLKVVP